MISLKFFDKSSFFGIKTLFTLCNITSTFCSSKATMNATSHYAVSLWEAANSLSKLMILRPASWYFLKYLSGTLPYITTADGLSLLTT